MGEKQELRAEITRRMEEGLALHSQVMTARREVTKGRKAINAMEAKIARLETENRMLRKANASKIVSGTLVFNVDDDHEDKTILQESTEFFGFVEKGTIVFPVTLSEDGARALQALSLTLQILSERIRTVINER